MADGIAIGVGDFLASSAKNYLALIALSIVSVRIAPGRGGD